MAVFYKNGHKKSRSHDQRENGIYVGEVEQ
jgi:hypothetical protein